MEDGPANEVEAGRAAAQGIEAAARLALSGEVDAIVTGPVNKAALHAAGYRFPGITEFLAHIAGDIPVAMMLTTGRLRVVLVTTHLSLREAIASVTTERVVQAGRIALDALQRWWGVATPRLALCALNPHAGEGGLFGDEDERILEPAATALEAAGPLPADTVFVRALRGEFDAVLARGSAQVSFDSLAKRYADPLEPKLAEDAPLTEMPPEYQKAVAADTTLGLKPVFTEGADTPRIKFIVLEVTARHAAGELSFDDVKLRIRQSLSDQLAIRHFIDQLRRQIYVDIRL